MGPVYCICRGLYRRWLGAFLGDVRVRVLFGGLPRLSDPIFHRRPLMSLTLGLIAALAWGIHDLCVRHVSQTTGIFASIVTVLAFGCLLVGPVSLFAWGEEMGANALPLSLLSGVMFGLAAIAHYKAFSIGPVRLVATIIGTYPILSVAWAMITGTDVSILQWMAVGLVIAGVGYVAGSGDQDASDASTGAAIFWSILAGAGFAITFAIGQAASAGGGELSLLAPTRIAALVTVLLLAIVGRINWHPGTTGLWILAIMGGLDAVALASVISSGGSANPEFASVGASTFGLITVVLAAIFLRERIYLPQWGAVAMVFTAIAYLGL
jgi:drug/metabolite transporter (DMT)-like permease